MVESISLDVGSVVKTYFMQASGRGMVLTLFLSAEQVKGLFHAARRSLVKAGEMDPDDPQTWGYGEQHGLSKLLWDARENLEMFADMLIKRDGAESVRKLVIAIDQYRAERGWSADGFGGEGG